MVRQAWLAAVLALPAAVACDRPTEPVGTTPTSSASPSTSASAAAPPKDDAVSPHAGTWAGTFEAKKADVSVPNGVRYPVWKDEPGDEARGKATLTLVVDRAGQVTGESSGSLGNLLVSGSFEEGALYAQLRPSKPGQGLAMRGLLNGKLAGPSGGAEVLDATLRVSNHDGTIARQATVKLSRADAPQ